MSFAPSRYQVLFIRYLTVLLTVSFSLSAQAKIKGFALEQCDVSEEDLKANLVDKVLSEKTLCGEGVEPEHTGGFTCNKLARKDCKESRLRCVTQFICKNPEEKTEVILRDANGNPIKVDEPKDDAATEMGSENEPVQSKTTDLKPTSTPVPTTPAVPTKTPPVVKPTEQSLSSAPVAQPKVVSTAAPTAPEKVPTPIPPPALSTPPSQAQAQPQAGTQSVTSAPSGATSAVPVVTPPVPSPPTWATQPTPTVAVEKLNKPIDVQQIDLDSFQQNALVPPVPSFGDLIGMMPPVVLIIILMVIVFFIAAFWRVFEKAGERGIYSIIPIYNIYKLHQIVGQPGWWVILDVIPLVGFITQCLMNKKLAEKFQAPQLIMVVVILLPPIGYAILAFSPKYQYLGAGGGVNGGTPATPEWQEIEMLPPEEDSQKE